MKKILFWRKKVLTQQDLSHMEYRDPYIERLAMELELTKNKEIVKIKELTQSKKEVK